MWATNVGPPYHRAVTDSRSSSGAGPSVCPFVALAEDRDRRADTPDDGNRCYAERAPRRRDLVYQSEYCYAPEFAKWHYPCDQTHICYYSRESFLWLGQRLAFEVEFPRENVAIFVRPL